MLSANTSAAAAAPAVHQFSSLSSPSSISPFADLPPIQAQVATALAEGSTVSAAAQQAGVHRTTVHHWLRTLPAFARAVDQARKDYRNQLADEIAELGTTAGPLGFSLPGGSRHKRGASTKRPLPLRLWPQIQALLPANKIHPDDFLSLKRMFTPLRAGAPRV